MYLFDVTWRRNGTSHVKSVVTLSKALSSRNILHQTRSFYVGWLKSYVSFCDFVHFRWPWPWPWVNLKKKNSVPTRGQSWFSVRISAWSVQNCGRHSSNRQTNKQTDENPLEERALCERAFARFQFFCGLRHLLVTTMSHLQRHSFLDLHLCQINNIEIFSCLKKCIRH